MSPTNLKAGITMMKKIIDIVAVAFAVGIVAKTGVFGYGLAHGSPIDIGGAIELGVCWLVVLAVFLVAVIGGHGFGKAVSGSVLNVWVSHHEPARDDKPEDEPEDETPTEDEPETDEPETDETPTEEDRQN